MENRIKNIIYEIYNDSKDEEVTNLYYQLFIVGMKSLILSEHKLGAYYNESKLKQELNLLREYFSTDKSVRVILNTDDKGIFAILLPAIMMNKEWDAIIENTVRLFNVCSIDYNKLPRIQLMASLISGYLINKNIYVDNQLEDEVIESCKNKIIDISIKEMNEITSNEIDMIKILKYEQERIKIIELLNKRCIDEMKYLNIVYGYINCVNLDENISREEEVMIDSFAKFIVKMRSGRINPKMMKYDLQAKPTFSGYLKVKKFSHPIMGTCEIYDRKNGMIYIKTKIGNIRMKIDEKN